MCAVQLAAIFYAFQHRMTGWEPLWVLGFECVLYATNTFVPDIGTPTPHTHQPTTSIHTLPHTPTPPLTHTTHHHLQATWCSPTASASRGFATAVG